MLDSKKDLKLFFDDHYNKAVLQATRILNNPPQAEDIAQECIIKLWEQKHQLSDKNISGYYHTMVRNRCIDHIRKKKLQLVEVDEMLIATSSADALEYAELKEKVKLLINSLPEKCRQVFVLSRFEQLTYKEIADQLEISKKTVENQISKALKVMTLGLSKVFFIFSFFS